MKTVKLKLYTYDELSPRVQQKLIQEYMSEAYNYWTHNQWDDIRHTAERVEQIAGINCQIVESSQGFYSRLARELNPDYALTDEEQFKIFQKKIENELTYETCFDSDISTLIADKVWPKDDPYISYASFVAQIICEFYKDCNNELMEYFSEDSTIDYFDQNEIYFTKDGRRYEE